MAATLNKETYRKKVRRINAAAAFFARQGYQCEVTFYARLNGMTLTVFFRDIEEKDSIRETLRQYAEGNDEIVFKDFQDYHFNTLKLEIFTS